MKKLLACLVALAGLTGCSKKEPPIAQRKCEVNSVVVTLAGVSIPVCANSVNANLSTAPPKAYSGCGYLGGGTFIDVTSAAGAAVYIQVYGSGFSCVSTAGIYSYNCEYRVNVNSQNTPIYENRLAAHPGTINFTTVTDKYMEGNFTATCRYQNDSVTVTGNFKADL